MLSSMICHLLSINEKGGEKTWEVGSLMTMEELQPKTQEKKLKGLWKTIYYIHITYIDFRISIRF